MRININLEGEFIRFDVQNFPVSILSIKNEISRLSGIPHGEQNLFDYPEVPDQGPGLRLYEDNHVFQQATMTNARVNFVLTFGKVSAWTYFYVEYLRADDQPAVVKFNCHKFTKIAQLKGQICRALQKSELNPFQLYHDLNGSPALDDDSNIYHSGIQNGSSIYVVDADLSK